MTTENKATMTLNLSTAEMAALEELASRKGLSKTAAIRQALRVYQYVDARVSAGYEMAWRDRKTGHTEGTIIVGCGGGDGPY